MELNEEQVKKALDWLNILVGYSDDYDSNMAMFTYQLLGILYDTCEELTAENERLREHTITYQTPSGEQTMPNLLSLDGDAATLYRKIEDKIKADTVRKMSEMLKEYLDDYYHSGEDALLDVPDMIDIIAKEMLEGKG